MHLSKTIACLFILLFLPSLLLAIEEGELLEVDQAFQFEAQVLDANTLSLQWTIAKDYFLYRGKFQFNTDSPGYTFGEPVFPTGESKHDEFFGDIEIYRGIITILLPVQRDLEAADILQLRVTSQGCADLGVCYPPHTQTASLQLPTKSLSPFSFTTTTTSPRNALSQLTKLGQSLNFGDPQQDLLLADQAFAFTAKAPNHNHIALRWDIAEGYYLYRDKITVALSDSQGVQLGDFVLPSGKIKKDKIFGQLEVFYQSVDLTIPLLYTDDTLLDQLNIKASFQGCAELGVCYPPIEKVLSIDLPTATKPLISASTKLDATPIKSQVLSKTESKGTPTEPLLSTKSKSDVTPPTTFLSEQDRIVTKLADDTFWKTLLFFFGIGLLLAFTPCVFPMIPILSSILVGQGKDITPRKSFLLSLVYVSAMVLVYTLAGVLAALLGLNLQAAFQNTWVLAAFAALFVLLSLSMFGFYELQLPSSWQAKLAEISNRQEGGTYLGVAIMGLLSALIIGPCVTAPLVGILSYIGQTRDVLLGGSALFALSMGMGTPLLLIGASAGKLLPKAGVWMDATKAICGVLLLAVAVWLLERILPPTITLCLWALLLIVSAVYMGILEPLPQGCSGWRKLWKGIALALLVYGVVLLIGAASGSRDPLQPLNRFGTTVQQEVNFTQIKSYADLQRELARGQPVMLDFYADWCVSCKGMERYTFPDPKVQTALQGVHLLQADVSADDMVDKALKNKLAVINPPTILFFGPDGQERRPFRLVGPMDAEDFAKHAKQALQ